MPNPINTSNSQSSAVSPLLNPQLRRRELKAFISEIVSACPTTNVIRQDQTIVCSLQDIAAKAVSRWGKNTEEFISALEQRFKDGTYAPGLKRPLYPSLFKRLQSVSYTEAPDLAMDIANSRAVNGYNCLTIMEEHNLPWDRASWEVGNKFDEFVRTIRLSVDQGLRAFGLPENSVNPNLNISEDDIKLMIDFGLKAIKEGPAGERVVNGERCDEIRMEYGLPLTGHVADELDQIAMQGTCAKFHRVDSIELPEPGLPGALGLMPRLLQIQPLNQPHIRTMLSNGASCNDIARQAHIIEGGWAWDLLEEMVAIDGPAYRRVSAGENPETVAQEYGISPQGEAMKKLRRLAEVTQNGDRSDAQ